MKTLKSKSIKYKRLSKGNFLRIWYAPITKFGVSKGNISPLTLFKIFFSLLLIHVTRLLKLIGIEL